MYTRRRRVCLCWNMPRIVQVNWKKNERRRDKMIATYMNGSMVSQPPMFTLGLVSEAFGSVVGRRRTL